MKRFPISLKTRLKQLICKHKTIGMSAYTMGINRKLNWLYITYECKCGLCVSQWEKDTGQFK